MSKLKRDPITHEVKQLRSKLSEARKEKPEQGHSLIKCPRCGDLFPNYRLEEYMNRLAEAEKELSLKKDSCKIFEVIIDGLRSELEAARKKIKEYRNYGKN